ncbi:hypothetical protein MHYP_G00062060 [Metynnis hypsauchen]
MDPAELDPIKSALHNQGAVIGRHEQLLHDMMQQLTLLVRAQAEGAQPASASASTGVGAGASAATPVLASPFPPADPTPICGDALVANPERYAGDPETCRGFLLQCSLVFEQQPSRFPTEAPKTEDDTYSALNPNTTSPDYDTLTPVRDSPSDPYSALNPQTTSSDYDTLAVVRPHPVMRRAPENEN